MRAIRARLPAGTAIELWWSDEARVGRKDTLPCQRVRRGSRPSAPKDQRTAQLAIPAAAILPILLSLLGLRCSSARKLHARPIQP